MTKTIKYFSMFSGVGGFEYGLQQSKHNFKCVGFSEIDKYARSIYEKNFPNHICYGDATKINTKDLPDFEFFVGGFPCQAFSIAGKRKGFADIRGTLFFELARVLKDKRPPYFLFENVKGLLSHEGGRTIETIFRVLNELGYNVRWQIYNSKDYGVPQNRERIFIKGYLGNRCRRKVLSIGRENQANNELKRVNNHKRVYQGQEVYDPTGVSAAITSIGGNLGGNTSLYKVNDNSLKQINNQSSKSMGDRVYDTNGISRTLCGDGGGLDDKTGLYKVDIKTQVMKRKHTADPILITKLQKVLKTAKQQSQLTITDIVEELQVNKTTVEHWFRTDQYFSIPPAAVWYQLKELIGISTDEFDKFITEWEIVDGVYDMANRAYLANGLAPTLNSDGATKIIDQGVQLLNGTDNGTTIANLDANYHKGLSPSDINQKRNRRTHIIEKNQPKVSNEYYGKRQGRLHKTDEIMNTLTEAMGKGGGHVPMLEMKEENDVSNDYRIRRLTPRECERLQGFPDDWTKFGKNGELISDTQRYKCCGNAVTTTVITAIVDEMFDEE